MDIPCRRAAELTSDAMNRRLTRWERVQLGLHLMLCSACRRYRRQIRLLSRMFREHPDLSFGDPAVDAAAAGLSAEAKERIRAALRDAT